MINLSRPDKISPQDKKQEIIDIYKRQDKNVFTSTIAKAVDNQTS